MKTFANYLIDAFFRFMVGIMMLFPYAKRVRIFGGICATVVGPLSGYNKRSRENLRLIFPDMSPERREQIARAVARNFGKNIIENYSKDDVAEALKHAEIGGEGLDALKAAHERGQPVLLLSGHIGNYEAVRLALYNMGLQSAGLYRPASNLRLNSHYVKTLEYLSGPAFPQTKRGILGFVRHLKAGGIAAILFDVRDKKHETIDFLGQPAHTSTFPAEIAMKTGAVVIPCFAHRCDDGITHSISFEAPIEHSTPREMMIEATKRLEAQIMRFPEQWLWIHKRWESSRPRPNSINHTPS